MDNGLVHVLMLQRWRQTESLNPFCNGQWSRTGNSVQFTMVSGGQVLILFVMDNGLVLHS